jgi:hypothetical protein
MAVLNQTNWRFCRKCCGLFFRGFGAGTCPAGGGHDSTGSLDYILWYNQPPQDKVQRQWRFCQKCLGLFFDGFGAGSCPAGAGHDSQGSYRYGLAYDQAPHSQRQDHWRFCRKCCGVFFDGFGAGSCPAGAGHDSQGSFMYLVGHRGPPPPPPPPPLPARLQFRLRYFVEHESTDNFLQGANDEVWVSAIGTDSAQLVLGHNNAAQLDTITGPTVGDVSDDAIRDPWQEEPFPIIEFDLRRPSGWPRTFAVTLLIVEEDNEQVGESFEQLEAQVGDTIKSEVERMATAAAASIAGAAIGSLLPGAGTAVGAAIGALGGAAYDLIIAEIQAGLDNEVFTPQTLMMQVPNAAALGRGLGDVGQPQLLSVNEHGASYDIEYDWHLVE